MKVLRPLVVFIAFVLLGGAGMGLWIYFHRPGLDQYTALHYAAPPADGSLNATWFGTTAVLLSDGRSAIFVDPFFTRPEGLINLALNRGIAPDEALIKDWLQRAGVEKLDAVLVSHSHYDHAMDAGVVARLSGARLVGSESTANIGRGAGLPESQIQTVKPGEPVLARSYVITFIQSRHAGATGGKPTGDITEPLVPPAGYMDYKQGGTYSILIEHARGAVLHHGSAGFVSGALKNRKADVVFLGVALIEDLPAYLAEVVDLVGAKRLMPTHWDDFSRPLDKPLKPFPILVRLDRFFADMQKLRPDLQVQTLQLGKPVALLPPAAP